MMRPIKHFHFVAAGAQNLYYLAGIPNPIDADDY
jgi:hypothetical protein